MTSEHSVIPMEAVASRILLLRGEKVILDADLAELYGVTTRRLNEQVKRNQARFPEDFMFQLSTQEKKKVVAICDHLARLRFSPVLPNAFTEIGFQVGERPGVYRVRRRSRGASEGHDA